MNVRMECSRAVEDPLTLVLVDADEDLGFGPRAGRRNAPAEQLGVPSSAADDRHGRRVSSRELVPDFTNRCPLEAPRLRGLQPAKQAFSFMIDDSDVRAAARQLAASNQVSHDAAGYRAFPFDQNLIQRGRAAQTRSLGDESDGGSIGEVEELGCEARAGAW